MPELSFDDLLPKQQPSSSGGGLSFDDLIPQQPQQVSRERGVMERAGQAISETAEAGLTAAARPFEPPKDVSGYRGPSGAWRSFKETGQTILSPLTATLGAGLAGVESLGASGLGAAQRGLEELISRGAGYVSPELAERLRAKIPSSEQAYEAARPYVGEALSAIGTPPATALGRAKQVVSRGPEAKAGRTIEAAATDPAAVRAALENPPAEIIPRSAPTTFEATGDLGLGQLQRAAENRNRQLFQARQGEQNTARLQALEDLQKTGSSVDVADHLRDVLRRHEAGINADYKLAEMRAWEETQRLGGTHDPTTYGNILRRELQGAEEAARAGERQLWQQVDPDGTLVAGALPIQELERGIYGRMTQAGSASIIPAERTISELIQNYPGTVPFKELTDLRSLVSTAMRQERMANGQTPALGRLIQLRSGIEDAVTNRVLDLQNGQFVRSASERLRAASAATRERAGRFNISPIRDILRREGLEGPYKLQEGAVPGRLIRPGPSGYDSSSAFLRAVGNQEGLPVLQDAVAADMRRAVVGTDGLVNSKKLSNWMSRHQDALRAIDERDGGAFSQNLRNAGDASDMLGRIAERRALVADNVAKSEFGKLIGSTDPTDINRIIGGLLGGQQSVQKSRALAQMLTTPAAKEGAQRAIVDYIRERFISNTPSANTGENIIRADQFQTFVRQSRPALAQFMSPEQIGTLEAIAADIRRSNMILQTKVRGSSNTMQDALLAGKSHGLSFLSHLVSNAMGTNFWKTRHAIFMGKSLITALRDTGATKVSDLVDLAMLDPAIARDFLKKAQGELRVPGLKRWAVYETAALTKPEDEKSKKRRSFWYKS